MAKPTAVAEVGGAKVLLLADATATTPVANMPAAVEVSASGEGTYPVGWMGVATHADGDSHVGAGGFTPTAAPVMLSGLKDYASTPLVHGARGDEQGNLYTGGHGWAAAGKPLVDATAGGTSITNTATETALATIDAARFQYLTSIHGVCRVLGANNAIETWTLRDGAAGTILWVFDAPIDVPVNVHLGQMAAGTAQPFYFPVPLKTSAINKQFTMQASAADLGTWRFHVNGYLSTL